jgi:hypothetical protein
MHLVYFNFGKNSVKNSGKKKSYSTSVHADANRGSKYKTSRKTTKLYSFALQHSIILEQPKQPSGIEASLSSFLR